MVGEVECRALGGRCLYQFGEHAWRHGTIAEWPSVGMAYSDGGKELGVGLRWAVWPGQPDRREQQRLPRIREQPDHRLAPGHRDRQAQVEQCGTAPEVHRPAVCVGILQHPRRVGVKLDGLVGAQNTEPPRLGVVHRRRKRRHPQQSGDHIRRRKPRRHSSAGMREICLFHGPRLAVTRPNP